MSVTSWRADAIDDGSLAVAERDRLDRAFHRLPPCAAVIYVRVGPDAYAEYALRGGP